MAQQITLRRGLSTEWTSVGGSLVLSSGEPGFETDTGKLKIGNGSAVWNALPYAAGLESLRLQDLSNVASTSPSTGQVLKWDGTVWAPAADSADGTTTYTISAETATGGVDLRLTGSDSSTDSVKLAAGSNVTITRTDANTITISGEAFNTADSVFTGTTTVDTLDAQTKIIADDIETLRIVSTENLSIRATNGTVFGSASAGVDGVITQVFNQFIPEGHIVSQYHNNPNSTNYHWMRSRGTAAAPTVVLSGDTLADMLFSGYNGTAMTVGAAITVKTETVSNSKVRARIAFATENGTDFNIRAELDSAGTWKTNAIQAYTANGNLQILNNGTGNVQLPAGTTIAGVLAGSIVVKGTVANEAALPGGASVGDAYIVLDPTPTHLWSYSGTAWADLGVFQGPAGADGSDGADGAAGADGAGVPVGGSTGQVLIKSSGDDYDTEWGTASTVAAINDLTDVVITGTPTNGQVLKYNGSNWVNAADATSTIFSRSTASATTLELANGATGPINITGFKSYALLKIQTSAAAWVRIYTSEAARIADASRLEGEDPLPGAGIIAEVITTGAETVVISPGVLGFNNETVPTTTIPCRVTNKSGSTATITVTTTLIKLED